MALHPHANPTADCAIPYFADGRTCYTSASLERLHRHLLTAFMGSLSLMFPSFFLYAALDRPNGG